MEGQQNEALEQRQNCCCLTGHRSLPSDPDRLAELSRMIQSGRAGNITEAIRVYEEGEK